jgi:hypothetical protein
LHASVHGEQLDGFTTARSSCSLQVEQDGLHARNLGSANIVILGAIRGSGDGVGLHARNLGIVVFSFICGGDGTGLRTGCHHVVVLDAVCDGDGTELQAGGPDVVILSAVSGRYGVGLYAGGHVVVVLKAVRDFTVVFDTLAAVWPLSLARSWRRWRALDSTPAATMLLSSSPFIAGMVPRCTLVI